MFEDVLCYRMTKRNNYTVRLMIDETRVTLLAEPYVPLGLPIGATVHECLDCVCMRLYYGDQ